VAIYYWDGMTLPLGNVTANGGSGGLGPGQNGSIYTEQTTGETISPAVLEHTPRGRWEQSASRAVVLWSEAILASSFSAEDVTITTPSGVTIYPAELQIIRLAEDEYELTFPNQTADGRYTLCIGPDVTDLAGNPMALAYQGEWTIDTSGPRVVGMTTRTARVLRPSRSSRPRPT
jgi:hypothetical protein